MVYLVHTMAATAKASSSRSPSNPPTCKRAPRRTRKKNMPIPYSVNVSMFKALTDDMIKVGGKFSVLLRNLNAGNNSL